MGQNRYIWPPILRLTPPTEAFPWDDLRKIFHGCQRMARVPNGVKNIAESFDRLSRVHERYRRQTDGRQHIAFAKSHVRGRRKTRRVSRGSITGIATVTTAQQFLRWATVPEQSGQKSGVGLLCSFRGGELGPHLTQSRLGRGLPPYHLRTK